MKSSLINAFNESVASLLGWQKYLNTSGLKTNQEFYEQHATYLI